MRDNFGAVGLRFALLGTLVSMGLAAACGSSTDGPQAVNPNGGNSGSGGASAGNAGRPGGSSGTAGSLGGAQSTEAGAPGDAAGSPPNGDAGDGGAAGGGPVSIHVSPAVLQDARVSKAYTATLTVPGVASDLSWSIVGSLPPGLALGGANMPSASIAGTPTSAGVYPFGIQVKTSLGGNVTQNFTLRVRALPWVLYTTPDGAGAVDLSSGTPGTPHVFSRALATGESVVLLGQQPQGTQLVFGVQNAGAGASGWITSFAGAVPTQGVRVDTPQSTYSTALYFTWSQDGKRLAWTSDITDFGPTHAFVADMSGPAPGVPYEMNGTLPSGGSASNLSVGGTRFFFNEYGPTSGPAGADGNRQMAVDTSTLPPSEPTPLTDWQGVYGTPSADGSRFMYYEQINDSGAGELRVVGVGGAKPIQPVRLHAALTGMQSASYGGSWSADGSSVFFTIDHDASAATTRLYRVRMTADGPLPAEALTDGTALVGQFAPSPDGKRVLYTQGSAPQSADTALYVVDVSGTTPGAAVKVSGPFVAGGTLFPPLQAAAIIWSPDSQHIAYVADALQKGRREAFLVDVVNAPQNPKRLNTSLPSPTSSVEDPKFSPDGSWVELLGDLDTAGVPEQYLVPLTASGPGLPQKIGDTLGAHERYTNSIFWAPDSSYMSYTVNDSVASSSRGAIVAIGNGTASAPIPIASHANSVQFLPAGF
jgi:Putative Ig domain/WD40-like Beta Propeller Repeat